MNTKKAQFVQDWPLLQTLLFSVGTGWGWSMQKFAQSKSHPLLQCDCIFSCWTVALRVDDKGKGWTYKFKVYVEKGQIMGVVLSVTISECILGGKHDWVINSSTNSNGESQPSGQNGNRNRRSFLNRASGARAPFLEAWTTMSCFWVCVFTLSKSLDAWKVYLYWNSNFLVDVAVNLFE